MKIKIISIALLTLCSAASILGQDKTAELDKMFSQADPNQPGCTAAVSQNGKLVVDRAYGSADLERSVAMSTGSVLDAGSVQKQFVAASVLLLVEDGKLSLTEDIRKYIPEMPDMGHKVTLDHLLTHTGGIRDWTGLRPLAAGDPDVISLILRQKGLNFAPGDEWSYSNSGYELLKEIVARTSGMSLADFTQKRLWQPLGMRSTRYVADMDEVVKNRALAYAKEKDRWKLDMYFGNDRGGGGLLTTARDLVIWNDALSAARLGKFVTDKMHEPATLNNGRKLSYARGLIVETNLLGRIVWHTGGAAGYSTAVGRYLDQGVSFAVMCNSDGMSSREARRITALYLPSGPDTPESPSADSPVVVAPADLAARAGLYFNEQNKQVLRLGVNNNALVVAGGGPLTALAADRFKNARATPFFLSGAEIELRFLSPDRFEIKTKDGETAYYRRPQPWAPAAEDLQAFAGRYRSDEAGGYFDIAAGKASLTGRLNDKPGPALEFKPIGQDVFQLAGVLLRFVRDKDGKVIAVDYSNPVVRNIQFAKLSDGK